MSSAQVGAFILLAALPSVVGAKLGGGLGNRHGRARVVQLGLVLQGASFALGPKRLLPVTALSLSGTGFGIGAPLARHGTWT